MKVKEKIDPYTGETFYPKRRNQKFAVRQNRIDFHNDQAALIRDAKAPINSPLHRNFIIVRELMNGHKEKQFHKEFLRGRKFSFEHITHADEHGEKFVFGIYNYIWFQVLTEDNQPTEFIKIITK